MWWLLLASSASTPVAAQSELSGSVSNSTGLRKGDTPNKYDIGSLLSRDSVEREETLNLASYDSRTMQENDAKTEMMSFPVSIKYPQLRDGKMPTSFVGCMWKPLQWQCWW
jgi:hypothetical protein